MMFENVKEIEVKAVNGRLDIEGWDNDYVEVNYTEHGEVNVQVKQKGSKLIIKEEPKKRFLNLLRENGWAEIEVKAPRGILINAKNVNGELNGKGVKFEEATTVNGEIHLENCEAEMLSTVNGRVTAHLTVAGPLKASTVNGEMKLTVEDLEGDVEVNCVNGNVRLYLTEFCDARIVVRKVNGDVKLVGIDPSDPVIGTGEVVVSINTVNGDVRVELV